MMMSLLLVPLLFAEGVALWASQGRYAYRISCEEKRGTRSSSLCLCIC
jgi:hypothetical protein